MDTPQTNDELITEIRQLMRTGQADDLRDLLKTLHPADITEILEALPSEKALLLFGFLPDYEASEVLDETGSRLRAELVEKVDDERLADLLDTLPMDDAAEFVEDLEPEVADRLLALMDPDEAAEVRELLSYAEDTAGRLMTRDVAVLRMQWTVSQAFDYLRSLEDTETLHHLYVVDVIGRLLGVVPIRNIILAQPDTLIDTLTLDRVITVEVTADQEEIAETMSKYDYTVLPVVDESNVLLGVITVDDALDILEEEATEDIQRLGGSEPLEQPYFAVPLVTMVRKRIVWLLLLLVASTLSSLVVNRFTDLTAKYATLIAFMPLIIGAGGNAGSQTVSTIIRAVATDEIRLDDLWRTWRREVAVGLLLGICLGAVGWLLASQGQGQVALVIGLTLPLVVMWANSTATIVPIVAQRVGIDPALISAPLITTVVDATGLLIYLSLATYFLG